MLNDDVRRARIEAGLTQSGLARLAGVPRKQVRALESGANVTLATLRNIAQALPNLKRVTLGGLEIALENADLDEARRAAMDLFDVTRRLVAALGAAPPHAADRRHPPDAESEREKAQRFELQIDDLKRRRRRDDT